MRSLFRAFGAALFLLTALVGPALADGLFTTPSSRQTFAEADAVPPFLATARARDVVLDVGYLTERIAPVGIDAQAGRLSRVPDAAPVQIELFPGVVVDLDRTSISEAFGGGFIWTGEDHGAAPAWVNLVIRNGRVTGHVSLDGERPTEYRIDPLGANGLHRITELDGGAFPPESEPLGDDHGAHEGHEHDAVPLPQQEGSLPQLMPQDQASADGETQIDVLVAYTPASANLPDIEGSINLAVSLANTGFSRSNIQARYRLVGMVAVQNYAERAISDMLTDLASGTLAAFQPVHQAREDTGADLVSLISSNSGGSSCGIGYRPNMPGPSSASFAFSVTAANCISGHTFAHELGHNAGLNHDRYVISPTPSNSVDNYGHVDVARQFRTIMAYPNRCSAAGVSCTRINNFSNPSVSYNGGPTGILVNNPGAADSARWFNAVRTIVAAYRNPPGPPRPANDDFANRTVIALPGVFTGDNVNATAETGQPVIWAPGSDNAVWWRYTPTTSGTLTVETCGSDFDTVLGVFTGLNLNALNLVGASNDVCGVNARVTVQVFGGTEYQIAVAGLSNASGNIRLTLDFVSSATVATNTTLIGPTAGTENDTFTYRATVRAVTGAIGEPTGTVIFRDNGVQFAMGTLDGNGQATGTTGRLEPGTHQITAHYLGFQSFRESESTPVELVVSIVVVVRPPNDNFANRITIAAPGSTTGTNVNATSEPGQPTIYTSNSTNAVWWRFTPALSGTMALSTCGSSYDTTLGVFTGPAVNQLTEVDSNDDNPGCGLTSALEVAVAAGVEYQIAVAGYNNAEGTIALALAFTPTAGIATTTVLAGPSEAILGQQVALTATVTATSGTPEGSVIFLAGGNQIATRPIGLGGVARLDFTGFDLGQIAITAEYQGTSTYMASTSAPLNLSVVDAPQLALGRNHSCERDSYRVLRCWGANASGQIGDGTTARRLVATQVFDATQQVVLGADHTCALRNNMRVYCWGSNEFGQLGDGTQVNRSLPTSVDALRRITQLAAGLSHTCALHENGSVHCWGSNDQGQLGDRTTTDSALPTRVLNLRRVVAISAGDNHTCALRDNGAVMCWGGNASGQLGNGTTVNQPRPLRVPGLGQVTQISAGENHTCALHRSQNLFCWGENSGGQLGDGSLTNRLSPVRVIRLTAREVAQVAAGYQHTCALMLNGEAHCWGQNESGQLGDGSNAGRWRAVPVAQVERYLSLATGGNHSCAIPNSGAPLCWGNNAQGQLGNNSRQNSAFPVLVQRAVP